MSVYSELTDKQLKAVLAEKKIEGRSRILKRDDRIKVLETFDEDSSKVKDLIDELWIKFFEDKDQQPPSKKKVPLTKTQEFSVDELFSMVGQLRLSKGKTSKDRVSEGHDGEELDVKSKTNVKKGDKNKEVEKDVKPVKKRNAKKSVSDEEEDVEEEDVKSKKAKGSRTTKKVDEKEEVKEVKVSEKESG